MVDRAEALDPNSGSHSRARPIAVVVWDDAARRAVERESIYLRERLRARVEALLREAGRQRVTLDDVEQARRAPSPMRAGESRSEPEPEPTWPVTFGAYRVVDPEGTIAICTLASEALVDVIAHERPTGLAIVGRALTENFGVEKVVANVVANPRLRVLVLCGTESRHRVGETLLALHTGGVDQTGRVIGATAPLPLVRSLVPPAVRIFQEKVVMVDRRGEDRLEPILERVREASGVARPPWAEWWKPAVATLRPAAEPPGMGAMTGRFAPDPVGLFLIGIGPSGRTIHVEHYTREGLLDRRVVGESAATICRALVENGLLGDLGHATYVGRELQKAELAVRLGLPYEQDRDLDLAPGGGP